MSNKILVQEIERLAQICRKEETNLLIGKYELTLNQSIIEFIGNEYKLSSFNNNINIKLNYLRQLFRKIPSIKIIGEKSSTDSVIHLNSFVSCVFLQLIRISFKNLVGLEIIRPQLKSLKCFKCFDTQVLDEEFWDLFGVWPQITSLTLSQNNITSVKATVIPSSVQVLDLSWNRIKVFDNIANYSVNNISKLDLSYNCLTEVPKLNDFSSALLNSLFLRGNLIENINGIEKLTKLLELDIGINCMLDLNSLISCLKKCKSLKVLWIDGNPFSFDPNTNQIIQKELTFLTKLNETIILREEKNIKYSDETNVLSGNQSLRNSSDAESDQFFDASCDSTDSNQKSEMNRKKKFRVIEIKDRTEIEEQLERLDLKSNHSSDTNLQNSSEAKELIQKRKELGEEWLVSLGPSLDTYSSSQKTLTADLSPSTSDKTTDNNYDLNTSQRRQSTEKSIRKISTISTNTTDDEIEILTEERTEWSRKELEDDTNIVIVENSETNETFFVYVREEDGMIFEKDCITGKVLRTHDLKVLTNVEIINDLELKICFDSMVYNKREVKYRFDSIESCLGFNDKFIIPWISQRKQKMVSEENLYECLKCGQNKSSSSQVICCANCGSDAIMMSDTTRKRRSGSDITILSQINPQNQTEVKYNCSEDINVWEELFSINSCYDNSFFTRVEHSLSLYIDVKFLEDQELIQGLVKCKAMTPKSNRMESAFLVVSNKNILILSVNENENYDNFDAYLKLEVLKPISSLIQIKTFPNLLTDQGFWLQFKEEDKQMENRSRTKSLISRLSSKRSSISETNSFNCLIVFYDQIIGKSFTNYFSETISKLTKIPEIQTKSQIIQLTENSMALNDDIIVINAIKSAEYKRNDMKNELKLFENIAVIVTEQLVIFGEMYFDFNTFYNIKVLYKQFIINLMPQISVNLQNNCLKLIFSDDNIEINFTINSYTSDSIKKILIPIKSQWEKAFDVSLPLHKI